MKLLRKLLFILLLAIPLTTFSQIREIPVPTLPDIAIASYDQHGPVIYYNPRIVAMVHPVVAKFFRMHEYGHHALNHTQRESFDANQYNRAWVRQSYEREADCYAAQRLTRFEKAIVIDFFLSTQGHSRPDWYHPTGYERALVIQNCR